MNKIFVCIVILFSFGCTPKDDLPITIKIDDWQFKKASDSLWLAATVPGNVHSDLLANELIEHPFIGDNEKRIQWISDTNWEYKTTLNVNDEILQRKQMELSFEGLDTYASVFLNDSLILKANNAFLGYKVDVKSMLKSSNELRILFEKTSTYEEKEQAKLNYTLPEGPRVFTRKAQFQYGWDWGPQMNTSGIWRPISLTAWNDVKIDDVLMKDEFIDSTNARLTVGPVAQFGSKEELSMDIFINDSIYQSYDHFDGAAVTIDIKNPKLWWPHNIGDPYLYDFKFVIREGRRLLDSVSVKKGIRTIELVTDKDSIGESFYFRVNNRPVYAKGANYIPQNSMQNRVKSEHYVKLINAVKEANMNMLRVWGGGIYENDIFYDLCDENGILVWQDFMYACAMYPGDIDFLSNVQKEASYNISRLRNHASIALWCGNNENFEGWHRWGWQEGRSDKEKEEIWNNYLKVFDSILPNTLMQLTNTDYWESSPKYGRGNPKYESEGDAHDWWIWHDAYPFEHLEEHVPRFMSEFGFQSFPSYETIKYINNKNSLDVSTDQFKNHQKHHRGFQLIEDYMQRDFPVPEDPEDYVYMSQLLQAYGITKGIEAHRRSRPYNMGTLYWQLNDCWPSVSWSSIDFFGNWKALHYKAKRSFENLLISSKVVGNSLKTYAINDSLTDIDLELNIQIMDFNGKVIMKDFIEETAKANSSVMIKSWNLDSIKFEKEAAVLVISSPEKRWLHYFTNPKSLALHSEAPRMKVSKVSTGFKIELSASTLQKDVFLYTIENGHFSDNFFDILPNETAVIFFKTDANVLNDLRIKTFNNFIRKAPHPN